MAIISPNIFVTNGPGDPILPASSPRARSVCLLPGSDVGVKGGGQREALGGPGTDPVRLPLSAPGDRGVKTSATFFHFSELFQ